MREFQRPETSERLSLSLQPLQKATAAEIYISPAADSPDGNYCALAGGIKTPVCCVVAAAL